MNKIQECKFSLQLLGGMPLKETFYKVAEYKTPYYPKQDMIIVNTPWCALRIHLAKHTFEVIELRDKLK